MIEKWTRPYCSCSYLKVKRLLLIVEDRGDFVVACLLDYDSPKIFTERKTRRFRGERRIERAKHWLILKAK